MRLNDSKQSKLNSHRVWLALTASITAIVHRVKTQISHLNSSELSASSVNLPVRNWPAAPVEFIFLLPVNQLLHRNVKHIYVECVCLCMDVIISQRVDTDFQFFHYWPWQSKRRLTGLIFFSAALCWFSASKLLPNGNSIHLLSVLCWRMDLTELWSIFENWLSSISFEK